MLETSSPSATHSGVVGALTKDGWSITERIMTGYHHIQAKVTAVHFYLNVCAFVTVKGIDSCTSVLPFLAELVEKAIQRLFQFSGKTLRQSDKFGCGVTNLIEQEFNVSNS